MAKNSYRKKLCKRFSSIRVLKRQNTYLRGHLEALQQLKEKINKLKQ